MPFEFSPCKLVYGGDALGYYRGRTVLVPLALPGERLEVEVRRTAKGVVRARPLQVLEPAPERVTPPCPYFARCGGCHYQHLDSKYQTRWKSEILRETLRRIGKIAWDAEIRTHTAHPWNYRNQAQLKVARRPGSRVRLGFFEANSHRLVPIDACLILSGRLNRILRELDGEAWSERLIRCREIDLLADDRDEDVMVTLRGEFTFEQGEALARDFLVRLPGVVSVAVENGSGFRILGAGSLVYRVGEFRYQISPASFFQASRFLLQELVDAVTGGETGWRALDLFAGVGLFTLPLAQRFTQVIAVESHAGAARDLAANTAAHTLTNVRTVANSAFDFLLGFAASPPDLVVMDPPRAGVGLPTLKLLARGRPHRLHYLSCSPPTLARDLGYLVRQGYRLNAIELFDLFPQTYHLECLARLNRTNPEG